MQLEDEVGEVVAVVLLEADPVHPGGFGEGDRLVGVEVADVLGQAGEGAGLADDVHRQRQALGVQPLDERVDELVVGLHTGEPPLVSSVPTS